MRLEAGSLQRRDGLGGEFSAFGGNVQTIPTEIFLRTYLVAASIQAGKLHSPKMARSLAKVQKKISKKKGNVNSLHENSRDSQKLRRAGARGEKLLRIATARAKANQSYRMSKSAVS